MIELSQVTKTFGEGETAVRAVDDLSFRVPRGAFWAIMGPSGSGKSTVLHLIAGLTPPTSGSILIDGFDMARATEAEAAALRRRRVGYILQTFNLLPFLTAEENVAMPLVLDGVRDGEIPGRVGEVLELVRMSHRAKHKPTELSGGEQQLIAIARSLVVKPSVLLADEPTGSLDRSRGRDFMGLLREVNDVTGVTVLLVTHDPVFATYGDKVLRMVDGKLDQEVELTEPPVPSRAAASS
ncbi:MAG: ABC transporter ATP-binding protein [Deltaproteobacteria bacterium]|nr:ABC transporter ATP-binding protein [Deltaproteobacteria bacterium]